MRQVKRWRYYCDHCRKAGGAKGHMVKHEAGCTANPERKCRICAVGGFGPLPLVELIEVVQNHYSTHGGEEGIPETHSISAEGLQALRTAADGCPVCMFAALRQSKTWVAHPLEFDLKKELAPIWESVDAERASAAGCHG